MSKLNIFLVLLLAGMFAFVKIESASADISSEHPAVTPTIMPSPTPTAIPIGVPETIQIPKIQVDAPIVPVGVDFQGKMSMPDDWDKTAWYSAQGAAKPGEIGNAVIAGHLDTIYGTKGHFYLLSQVQVGDEVIVHDNLGGEYHFTVINAQTYKYNEVPLEAVFGASKEKHLNLITCTGWYSRAEHNYSHRLVVYTKLVE